MAIAELFSLDDKTALVTGCNRGIGKAIAVALAQAGANIVGVSRTLASQGEDVQRLVHQCDRKFWSYQCDFSNRQAVYNFIREAQGDGPDIDILINNTGTIRRKPAAEHDDSYWDEVVEVNLNAPFVLSREFGKQMVERGGGKIIFIASLLTFQGGITVPGYAASKGGVGQLIKALANEWASQGINVNGIAPGYIRTDNTQALQADPVRSKQIVERIPAGRWGETSDLQGAAVFLSSPAANYLHGIILPVDGGWLAR